MKIIYAKKSSGIDDQGSFQNPSYYDKPNKDAESVVIYGDYPQIKADYEALEIPVNVRELSLAKPLTIDVKVGITPELQAVIDEAKAECEKVVAENDELKQQLEALKAGLVPGEPVDLTGLVPTEQFDAVALDLTNTKEQLATAQGEFIAFKNDAAAMQARIAELQLVDYSKLKVDELKDVLKLKGIEFPSDAKKDDLLALLPKE
ncbi:MULTISPECIES: HeH/LEM domain-containing protein [Acinetobacter]|uniref:HeH/LEM domain-containing protein n=1 Tax=Acinetobacter TaxID=469 RepID=UPI0002AEC1EE|nr:MULTISPECIES: HeH/LEM domain-containing protein [Acinetobacter]ELW84526.1 HeH/LEM domain protein [Acinetobacter sp. WC-743]